MRYQWRLLCLVWWHRWACGIIVFWIRVSLTPFTFSHYDDVIMSEIASQITSLTIVYSTVHSGADQSKHQSSASLAFVWEIHRWPVNFPHKWPVTRKIFPFDDVIMASQSMAHWIMGPSNCMGKVICKSLDIVFIHANIHHWYDRETINLACILLCTEAPCFAGAWLKIKLHEIYFDRTAKFYPIVAQYGAQIEIYSL